MKVKQVFTEKSAKWLKEYKERTGLDYKPTFLDNVPHYILLNENLEPYIKVEKVLNAEKTNFDIVKSVVKFTADQYQKMLKMGQRIDVITEDILNAQNEEIERIKGLIENARIEGLAEGKKAGIEEGKKAGIEEGKKAGIEEGKKLAAKSK